jgi:tellurite methyltransferase
VRRPIVEFRLGDDGDWVAVLACGHAQHVRHEPPLSDRTWVLEERSRAAMLGETLDCGPCDRAELPAGLALVKTTPEWDERSMPAGLRRAHRVPKGRWGRLVIREGSLRFGARTDPPIDVIVAAGQSQAIPPDVEHAVETTEPVRFVLEFWEIP